MARTVEVRPHPTKGRALHAQQAFPPGSVILYFTPLLLLPTLAAQGLVCTYCMKGGGGSPPRACTRCRAAYYCDAACQAADWRAAHAKECRAMQRVPEQRRGQLPSPARALMRALLVGRLGSAMEHLEGHVEQRRSGPRWKDMELMALAACEYAATGSAEDDVQRALELLCKIMTNGFQRFDPDSGQAGLFLEPTLAMANHSCIPNATVDFIGREAMLRAVAPIAARDEIEISYIDDTSPLSKRQQALATFHFECRCPRCKDDLNVYQACAMSPSIPLNKHSLAPDLSKLSSPPQIKNQDKLAVVKAHNKVAADLVESFESQTMPESLPERRRLLQAEYRKCQALVKAELWAISPLPQILTEISIYFADKGDFGFALAVASLISTQCDPYRYVAPFHQMRVKDIVTLSNLASNVAANLPPRGTITSAPSPGALHQKMLEIAKKIDYLSLSQMLLIMVLRTDPGGQGSNWEVFSEAREQLEDMGRLDSHREKELSLINAWKQNPNDDASQQFFQYAVVEQIEELASLAPAALSLEFESS